MNYDIVAGLDNPTLNSLVAQMYTAIYPNLFRNSIAIGQVGISSVSFDINQTPVVNLQPSATFAEHLSELLSSANSSEHALSEADKNNVLGLATAASFQLVAPSLALSINYSNGDPATTVNSSLQAIVNIQTNTSSGGANYLSIQITSAAVSIPDNQVLQQLLNSAVVPAFLVPYLNNNILAPIQIPALQFENITVSLPVPVVQQPFVTAYSALGTTQPSIPPPSNWPTGCTFVGVDTAVITQAAAIPFPLGPATGFNWNIISGTVGAQVTAPTNLSINSDGSINATIMAYANAQLTLHTPSPLPNVTFGPNAQASISATLKPVVNNGEVAVSIEGVPIPTFSFDWGIPSWIGWLFYPLQAGLAAALNAVLGPLLGNILTFPAIPVYTLPEISFTLAGTTLNVNIQQATTSSQNSMLMVEAQATLTSSASLKKAKTTLSTNGVLEEA